MGCESRIAVYEAIRLLSELSGSERSVVIRLVSNTKQPGSSADLAPPTLPLTKRQQDVLTMFAYGYTRREISESLSISVNTVSSHIKNIYDRLNIVCKADATRIALKYGLL